MGVEATGKGGGEWRQPLTVTKGTNRADGRGRLRRRRLELCNWSMRGAYGKRIGKVDAGCRTGEREWLDWWLTDADAAGD